MKHSLTVRLPESEYRTAKEMAERRGVSLNHLVREALTGLADHETRRRVEQAYDLLAEDPREADVDGLFGAQAEAAIDG